jgi:hypothetical protein
MSVPKLAAALVALALGGCSFRLALPPPPPSEWPSASKHVDSMERCTPWLFPPIADTAIALLFGSLVYLERNASTPLVPVGLAVTTVAIGTSAGYGYIVATECRRYQRLFATPE